MCHVRSKFDRASYTDMIRNQFFIFLTVSIIGCNLTEPENVKSPAIPLQQQTGPKMVRDFASAAIRVDGTVWTWGPGYFGTLGIGTLESSDHPVQALEIKNAIAIDMFGGMVISVDNNGNIYFWGDDIFYEEPPGFDTIVVVPTIISGLPGTQALVIGIRQRFYFLRNDGTVWCVQHDHYRPTNHLIPQKVEGLSNATQISESYALRSDGTLYDIIATIPNEISPPPNRGGPIPELHGIAQVENVWYRRTVILKSDSTVWAWGWNDFGQLGNGTFQDSEQPVRVGELTDIIAISAHYDYNLALKRDGTVWFWGLEIPTEKHGTSTPTLIQSLKKASAIYADYNSLVLCEDGTYWTFSAESKIPEEIPFR